MSIAFARSLRFEDRSRAAARALIAHRVLLRLALSLGTAFVWIGVYRYFYQTSYDTSYAFMRTALLYALAQSVTVLAVPLAARLLVAGVRRGMVIGVCGASVGFLMLGIFGDGKGTALVLLFVIHTILIGAYRAFYRVPYAVAVTALKAKTTNMFLELLVMVAPFVSGIALESSISLPILMGAVGTIAALSLVPLAFLPETYERYAWGYADTFGRLFAREHRGLLMRGFYNGIEGTALLLAWPIVVFAVSGRSYATTGALLSISLMAAALATVLSRRFAARIGERSVPFKMALAGSTWIMRLVSATPIDVFVADTYAHAGASPRAQIDRASFEQRADDSTYVDEFTVLKEEALALGRLAAALGVALIAANSTLSFAFVCLFLAAAIAAAASFSASAQRSLF